MRAAIPVRFYDDFRLQRTARLECEAPVKLGGNFSMRGKIGAYTYIRSGGRFAGVKRIGRYCSVAPDVVAGDGPHPIDWLSTHPFQWGDTPLLDPAESAGHEFIKPALKKARVWIGHDVWIGARAVILKGVSIGDGAIIAAGAVVTKDVPPYAVVGGVPAKIIRYRFSPDHIVALLKLRWWKLDAAALLGVQFNDIDRAIDQVRELQSGREAKLISGETHIVTGGDDGPIVTPAR